MTTDNFFENYLPEKKMTKGKAIEGTMVVSFI